MNRTCPVCRRTIRPNEPDPCLGELPGVTEACCGHGDQDAGYIRFENGMAVYFDAFKVCDWRSYDLLDEGVLRNDGLLSDSKLTHVDIRPSVMDSNEEET